MNLKQLDNWQRSPQSQRPLGHAHFWERAMLTRRQFLKTAATTTAVIVGSRLFTPGLARAEEVITGASPKPIPGGTTIGPLGLFHFFLPTDTNIPGAPNVRDGTGDPSTITDFKGHIGIGEFFGGTGVGTTSVHKHKLFWEADVRFISGEYVGVDGHRRHGAFAFI